MLKINFFVYKTLILPPNWLLFDSAALGGHTTLPTLTLSHLSFQLHPSLCPIVDMMV